jgi:hypothetical protein
VNTNSILAAPALARWALAVLAVAAIVAGILAMHFLTGLPTVGAQAHPMSAGAAAAPLPHAMGDSAPEPSADGCSVSCSPQHQMGAMACLLLALLASVLLVLASRSPHAWLSLRSSLARLSVLVMALAPPRPPSLTVLSISRT